MLLLIDTFCETPFDQKTSQKIINSFEGKNTETIKNNNNNNIKKATININLNT